MSNSRSSVVARVASVFATIAIIGGSAAQAAQNGGTFKAGTCGTASSQFVELTNGQATHGFNGTAQAAQLGQSGSGAAGLILNFHYANAQPTTKNDFRLLSLSFNDGESKGAQKTVTLKYCFQAGHGDGKTVEYSTTLNKLSPTKVGNGFKNVVQNSREFGGLNVKDMVLRRLAITVSDPTPSNITIGDISLSVDSATFHPASVDIEDKVGCNQLYACPNTTPF